MNGFVEGDAYKGEKSNPRGSTWYPTYRSYMKVSDIVKPVPSDLLVFADEHPDSINDAWMITDVETPNMWEDLPASYHGNACGMGFADGHAATHKWRNSSMPSPCEKVQRNGFNAPRQPGHSVDVAARHGAALSRCGPCYQPSSAAP